MAQCSSFLDIVQAYLNSDKAVLPVFNQTGLRVQQELSKEDPDTKSIEKLIISDQTLTAQVLRTANSAFYRGLNKVSTIREAIIRLGINEISNIVTVATQRENFRSRDPFLNNLIAKLWQHSVGCALGAQWLARQLKFENMVSEVFTAGLLHDIGKLLILKVIEVIKSSPNVTVQPSETFILEVADNLHTEQGYELATRWNLPDIYCHIIQNHHNIDLNVNDTLLILVSMADKACNKIGIGIKPYCTEISLETTPEASLLGLNGIFLARLEIQLEDSLAFAN